MEQDIAEIRSELKRLARLTEENNALLESIQRRARISFMFVALKWLIIVGLAIGAFYYIQPFLEQTAALYQHITGTKIDVMDLLKSIK